MNSWLRALRQPPLWLATAVSVAMIVTMIALRVYAYPEDVVPLTYVLPLLVGLWHHNRRLLWLMALCFFASAGYKLLVIMPLTAFTPPSERFVFLAMEWTNIAIAVIVVHAALSYREHLEGLTTDLRAANVELDSHNEELLARDEEVSRQNEELQSQTEELEQQAEELRAQAEELQTLNAGLQHREEALQMLLRLSSPGAEESQLLQEICVAVPRLLGEEVTAGVLVRDGDRMVVRAHHGLNPEDELLHHLPLEATLAHLVMERDQTAQLNDVLQRPDLQLPQPARGSRFRSVLSAPLHGPKRPIGALEVYAVEPRCWTSEQAQLLRWLAAQCSQVLTTLRLRGELHALNQSLETKVAERTAELQSRSEDLHRLAAQLTMAEQRERRRLAEILHDDLQQLLVAAKIRLSSQRAPADASRQTAAGLIDQAIECSRSLTVELSPPVLFQDRFSSAVGWLARRMHEKHGLEVVVTAEPEAEPDGENWRVFLFHALGECLFNVVKHAGVDRAEVRLKQEGHELHAVVADRGRGFADPLPAETHPETNSFGLFSLRQRSLLLGGTMEIHSAPGQGTRIEFCVPAAPRAVESSASPSGPPLALPLRAPLVRPAHDNGQIRVLLADDHTILRHGLASILHNEPGIEVVAEACDGQAAVELTRLYRPDVVVMDVTMPRLNGVEATQRLAQELPAVQVIGMSMHEDDETRNAMLRAGAVSYLTKGGPTEELLGEIRLAASKAPHRRPHAVRSGSSPSTAERSDP